MRTHARETKFATSDRGGGVSALLLRPERARLLFVFGHGAGAGMRHRFMGGVAAAMADAGIATFRYNFPYSEAGRRRPDRASVLKETVRSAVAAGAALAPDLPLVAGGKSMGGRMTSAAAAEQPLADVRGLVFVGFPLHAVGQVSTDRALHLNEVPLPMLFLQGTRDRLAQVGPIREVVAALGERAALHVVEEGDHSFHLPKRAGRTDEDVWGELSTAVAQWASRRLGV